MNRAGLIIFGDFIAFWISFIVILLIRFGAPGSQAAISTHILPFFILYLSWTLSFFLFGLYDLFNIKPTIPYLSRFAFAILTCFVVGIFLFYFVSIFGISPKTNLLFQVIGFGLISIFIRRITYTLFSKTIIRPVILIGSSQNINEIGDVIFNNPQLGLKIISHTDDFKKAINDFSHTQNAIFIFEKIPESIEKENVLNLYKNNSEILNVAQAYEKYLGKIPVSYVNQSWIIENINIKENIIYTIMKKIVDIIFAVFTLIVTSPIVLVCSLFIYFYDKGPVIYKQERVGLNGEVFLLYKLRSMIVESETNGAVWSHKQDNRVTPIGKIIRKLHIDEIPQMINIIKGDISVVGPRPERPEFVSSLEKIIPHYELRHIIRPGFTGWAQIKYRYANTIECSKEKFEYDLYYIKDKNIFIDFGIILRTIQIIFTH